MAREEFIRVRVSAEEKKIIQQKALSSYRTPSDYVRECCLDKEIIVLDGLAELVTELRRQGNNQTRHTNLMAKIPTFHIVFVRQMVYTVTITRIIGKAVERRRRKATRACTVWMAASCVKC